jgi:hypothetical protein
MAMNAATLATAIKSEMTAQGFKLSEEGVETSKMVDIIADKIVDHIQNNAEVVTNVTMPAGSILTTGTAAAQSNTPDSLGNGEGAVS